MICRRSFLGGLAAYGAFQGCRPFVAPVSYATGGVPNVKLGVLSDIHIRRFGIEEIDPFVDFGVKTFIRALEYFKDQRVDGVIIAGDLADNGMNFQLEAVARAWRMVFPHNRLPDGSNVERLFVTGNHDWEGFSYRHYRQEYYPDSGKFADAAFSTNPKANWERIWNEPYEPVWTKTVKGYLFVGAHWEGFRSKDGDKVSFRGAPEAILAAGRKSDPLRPFFYIQHPQPAGTCYGMNVIGHDRGDTTRVLSKFPNAFAISGHSHLSLTDERSLWQGEFTSLVMSSLRYTSPYFGDFGPAGLEDSKSWGPRAEELDRKKMMPRTSQIDGRQGSILLVFDDRIEISRHDFVEDEELDRPWIVPLPVGKDTPHSYERKSRDEVAPEFLPDACAWTERRRMPNRAGEYKDSVVVYFPSATDPGTSRAMYFEVTASVDGCERKTKCVTARGFHRSRIRQPLHTKCVFSREELMPKGVVSFSIVPLSSFGKRGKALVAS